MTNRKRPMKKFKELLDTHKEDDGKAMTYYFAGMRFGLEDLGFQIMFYDPGGAGIGWIQKERGVMLQLELNEVTLYPAVPIKIDEMKEGKNLVKPQTPFSQFLINEYTVQELLDKIVRESEAHLVISNYKVN